MVSSASPRCSSPSQMSPTEPLPFSVLLNELKNFYDELGRNLNPQVQASLERLTELAAENKETQLAEELLRFARSKEAEKKIRVNGQPVPELVLPSGCTATLYDIKIHGKGPDDEIYKRDEKIRLMIPRGVSVLEWEDKENDEKWSSIVIYGHKKFTGGIGDEDEQQPENNDVWRSYFIKDPSLVKKVVCMEKLNGEAAHIAGRFIKGKFYLIVGSKNVHMVIGDKGHIELYKDEKYSYAKVIAKTIWDSLISLDEEKKILLKSLLHHTRCTIVGEILQPASQHIVNLCYLKEPMVHMISMTSPYTGSQVDTLTAISPQYFLDICSDLGLSTAEYKILSNEEVLDWKEEIRRNKGSEGKVLYYVDKDENTIGLVKVKTTWYIILRALREKAVYTFTTGKKYRDWSLEEQIRKTTKRFREIQKWLKFSDDCLSKWESLGKDFLEWLDKELKKETYNKGDIRPKFPIVWNDFLRTTNKTDDIKRD